MIKEPYNKIEKVKILLDKAICNPKRFIVEISALKNSDK